MNDQKAVVRDNADDVDRRAESGEKSSCCSTTCCTTAEDTKDSKTSVQAGKSAQNPSVGS